MMRCLEFAILLVVLAAQARADVLTQLPTDDKVVALTFDACEAGEPMAFDRGILDYLLARGIPFTVFASGRFVETNRTDIEALAALDFVDIENHSWSHPNNMHHFEPDDVVRQVERANVAIAATTGRRPQFFRFPAGNYDPRGLKAVEDIGMKVVHWRWASGDPDPTQRADRLFDRVMANVQPGDVLIFHINGRAKHTAEALPRIVEALEGQGFRFVRVSDYVGEPRGPKPPEEPLVAVERIIDRVMARAPLAALGRTLN